jgi:hypothetical protein
MKIFTKLLQFSLVINESHVPNKQDKLVLSLMFGTVVIFSQINKEIKLENMQGEKNSLCSELASIQPVLIIIH